jgi:hypothetical protein
MKILCSLGTEIFKAVYKKPKDAAKECRGERAKCRLTSYKAGSRRQDVS